MSDLSFLDGSDFCLFPILILFSPLLFQFQLFIILFPYFYLPNHSFFSLNVKNQLKR